MGLAVSNRHACFIQITSVANMLGISLYAISNVYYVVFLYCVYRYTMFYYAIQIKFYYPQLIN